MLFFLMTIHFVLGFLVGILASLVTFASRYSSIPVIKTVMDATEYQGRSVWGGHHTLILQKYGHKILTIRLQGFIFFFTAESLRADVHAVIESRRRNERNLEWMVLDFRFVENFDTTAVCPPVLSRNLYSSLRGPALSRCFGSRRFKNSER